MAINKKISRKNFIRSMTVTGAAMASSSVLKPTLKAFAQSKEGANKESGEWKATTCQGCTSWCSIQAYVVNGRAIKLRGNPNSKVNGIAGCPRQHMSLQQVYDPDRLKVPMKRTNPKKGRDEDPKFVPISWDEALNTIADKIMDLRKNNETHKYMLMRGRYSYMRDIIYDRMTKIIGSPNNISHSAICAEAEKFGPYYTEGLWAYRQYDVANTRYMILWGADPVAANRQVSYYLSAWGDMLDRARVAVIDPRLSASATKADEWLPIKPGEDGALASAFAHVILTEGLWYKDFVGDFTEKSLIKKFTPGKTVPEEVNAGVPDTPGFDDAPLAAQQHQVKMSKKILILTLGKAAGNLLADLAQEQEVLAFLADMIIEIFAMESGLLRALKMIDKKGEKRAEYHTVAVQVYVNDAIPKIVHWSKQVLTFVEKGDVLVALLAAVDKLAAYQPVDTVNLRRRIAEKVIKGKKYPI